MHMHRKSPLQQLSTSERNMSVDRILASVWHFGTSRYRTYVKWLLEALWYKKKWVTIIYKNHVLKTLRKDKQLLNDAHT